MEYFCDPPSSWQRGSRENTSGLLGQYLPEDKGLSVHDQAQLGAMADLPIIRPHAVHDSYRSIVAYQPRVDMLNQPNTSTQ